MTTEQASATERMSAKFVAALYLMLSRDCYTSALEGFRGAYEHRATYTALPESQRRNGLTVALRSALTLLRAPMRGRDLSVESKALDPAFANRLRIAGRTLAKREDVLGWFYRDADLDPARVTDEEVADCLAVALKAYAFRAQSAVDGLTW